jgi:hypothetical protein
MPEYRAYFVGGDGHFFNFEEMVCDDDAKAIERTERLVDGHDIELWSGARFIAKLQHTSNEVRAFDRQIVESQRMSKDATDEAGSMRMDKLTSDLEQERNEQQKLDDEKK